MTLAALLIIIIVIMLPFAVIGAYWVLYVIAMKLGALYPERMRE